jgi:ferredoxin
MQIVIDTDRCIGAGLCALSVPDVFTQDEQGSSTVLPGRANAGLDSRVRGAVRGCPVQAISLTELAR